MEKATQAGSARHRVGRKRYAVPTRLAKLAGRVRPGKWLLLLTVVATTVFAIAGVRTGKVETVFARWLADDAAVIAAIDQLRARFGSVTPIRRHSGP